MPQMMSKTLRIPFPLLISVMGVPVILSYMMLNVKVGRSDALCFSLLTFMVAPLFALSDKSEVEGVRWWGNFASASACLGVVAQQRRREPRFEPRRGAIK